MVEKVLSARAAVFGHSTGDVASIRRSDGKHRLMLTVSPEAVAPSWFREALQPATR